MQMMLNLMQIAYVYISHTITQTQAACDDVKKKKEEDLPTRIILIEWKNYV